MKASKTAWLSLCASLTVQAACQHADKAASQNHEVPSVRVESHPAVAQDVPTYLPLTGELISERRTKLSANAQGQVVATYIERGQSVKAGEVLVRLDVRGAGHAAAEAKANLANLMVQRATTDKDCNRTRALQAKGAISQQEYDRGMAQCEEIIAQIDGAQARLRSAQQTLADGAVRAPFAGVITQRQVDVGDYVRPDSEVAVLLMPDPLRLRFTVPELNLFSAKVGTQVTFRVPASEQTVFSGSVRYVSGEVRQDTRDVVVEAVVDNHEHLLMPGMFATVMLETGKRSLPTVPKTAILDLTGHPGVMTVRNQRIEQHAVRLSETLGDRVAIEAGIAPGDLVVDVANPSIVDGSHVN
jgi:membrane fusion protein (multidrug efflux system)